MIEYLREATAILGANRARSLLTALGLVIGVMAVIAIEVLGSGTSGAVAGILGSINDRSFTLIPNARQGDFTRALIKPDDIARAKRAVPGIDEAVPAGGLARLVTAGRKRARLSIAGESDQRFITTPLRLGRAFTASDIASSAHAALLSDEGYAHLFSGSGDPDGKSLRIGDRRYVVVGVLEKPRTGIVPTVVRADVLLPYTTYERDLLRGKTVFGARFLVAGDASLLTVERNTVAFFTQLKHGRAQYQTFDRKSFSSAVDGIFGAMTFVVALIGAVSLVVAGIGILNIMLVSVAERTREIGVRKAIGATRAQILAQFCIEALLLSAFGCAVGLVLGLAIGYAVNRYALIAISGVVAPLPWVRSVLIATGFATVVTLLFGTYPAYRAASLDPIEALRYE
ncbi:MAG: ABC transporter permease [Candidatus Eremiobacteraeota bacterium]|nr:ABC transporter permease [Candidatus Eremiobacteraeota bacterium]